MTRPFDPESPGARRLADAHRRIVRDMEPTEVTMIAPTLDLPGRRMLKPGARVMVESAAARALIARGAARPG